MSVVAEFSIIPVGKEESISKYVTRAVEIVKSSGLQYQVGAMGTTIEGEWDDVVNVIGDCFVELKQDCDRINITIKAGYRAGKSGQISHMMTAVEEKLTEKG